MENDPHGVRAEPGNRLRTFGVEEELLLVQRGNCLPFAVAESVISAHLVSPPLAGDPRVQLGPMVPGEAGSPASDPELTFEVKQEQIEVVSPPVSQVAEIERVIRRGRALADAAAERAGAAVAAMATVPFKVETHLAPGERYARMEQLFGLTFQETLSCGFHVHVAVADMEEAVAVVDRIRVWLPVVLALSANSPFWQGRETGFASYRYQAWSRWPTTGPTAIFGSAEAYRKRCESILDSGVPLDNKMIYFDARYSPRVPTVEVRVADICMDAAHGAVVAGTVRALVETAAREWRDGVPPDPATPDLLRVWMFQASRAGLGGGLVDVATRRECPAADAVAGLFDHVREALEDSGEDREIGEGLQRILAEGTGASRQRAAYARRGSLVDVVADAARRTRA